MKIGVISLGCDKNRVDLEKTLSRLVEGGHTLVGSEDEADIIIVNTCAFTSAAKTEAVEEVLNAVSYVSEGKKVIVTGCLPQRYLKELQNDIPEVSAFLGVADYDGILAVIDEVSKGGKVCRAEGKDAFYGDRVLTTPYHYAYLKIADGCNNRCTYCAIPSIRGAYRSETEENLLSEAAKLADDGVKELILVAQDVTRYGIDFDGKPHIIELVKKLCALDFSLIRLLYLEPEAVTDELIDFIKNEPKIAKYMDIPLQHIDDGVLKRMGRHTTERSTRELINKVHAAGITVRSSFICGFPGESEDAFAKLKAFISEGGVDYAGFFPYSKEEGTAAYRLDGQMSKKIKLARADELFEIEKKIIEKRNKSLLGSVVKVIYDDVDYDKQMFVGRTETMTPDVDNQVFFTAPFTVDIGCFYNVEITGTDGIDLVGRAVK